MTSLHFDIITIVKIYEIKQMIYQLRGLNKCYLTTFFQTHQKYLQRFIKISSLKTTVIDVIKNGTFGQNSKMTQVLLECLSITNQA